MADITARAILIDKMTAPLKKIGDTAGKVGKDVQGKFSEANAQVKGLGSSMISLKGAFVGLAVTGVGVFAKSILSAGSEMEKLETQFKVLLGDMDSAKARMQELSKFAQTTPFQLTEVAGASRILQTLGGNLLATGEGLRMVGDASAISGESFENLAVHIGRAYSGLQANRPIGESMARLQELGLVTGETRNKIEALTKAAKGKEAWNLLEKELSKTKGGMNELSQTLGGLVSTLKDQFQGALRQLGEGGFFEAVKGGIKTLVDWFNILLDNQFFTRIGAGFEYLSSGLTAFSLTAITGFQRIWEVFKLTELKLRELDVAFYDLLPDSFVNKEALAESKAKLKEAEDAYKSVQDSADNTAIAATESWTDVANAWDKMVNGIPVEKYKEKTKNIVDDTKDTKDKLLKELEELRRKEKEILDERNQIKKDALILEGEVRDREIERRFAQLDEEVEKHKESQKEITENERLESEKRKALRQAEWNLAFTLTSSLSTIARNALGTSKKNANMRKGIAYSEAVINTALGVSKALASAPPPINFINAAAVGAAGAAQISTIATQKFATGGIVKGNGGSDLGDKQMIRVNAGEGVFTKEQMKALGKTEINMPITINGNADQGVVNQFSEIAQSIIGAIRNGDLDLINELNLQTA
jgi:hypothetical protein